MLLIPGIGASTDGTEETRDKLDLDARLSVGRPFVGESSPSFLSKPSLSVHLNETCRSFIDGVRAAGASLLSATVTCNEVGLNVGDAIAISCSESGV